MDPVPKLLTGLGWARLWRAKRGALEREKCNRETEGGGERWGAEAEMKEEARTLQACPHVF